MVKAVVVFQSKYGSTKRYAEWIAEELSCDIFDRKNIKVADLEPYDTIIYGGGLYAGGVSGIDVLTKNFDQLSNKNLILFTCGLADTTDIVNTDHIKAELKKVFTPQMEKRIKVFHLRGGIDYAKLNPVHKAMMAMLHKMVANKAQDTLTNEDKEMLNTYGTKVDFTDKSSITPIVSYVERL